MNAPQEITTTEDLLAKMRAGSRTDHVIRLRDLVIPVRVLSIDETNLIRRDALKQTQMTGGDEIDKNLHIQKTTLKLASAMQKNMPMITDKILSAMYVDEVTHLYDEYIKVMDDVNPTVEKLTEEQVRTLVDYVKKNGASARDLSLLQLRVIFSLFQDLIRKQDAQGSPKGN